MREGPLHSLTPTRPLHVQCTLLEGMHFALLSLTCYMSVPNGRIIARGRPRQVLGPYSRAYEPTGT